MSEEQAPVAAPPARELSRSPMRRAVLLVSLLGVLAAIVVSLFVLDGFVARLVPQGSAGSTSSAELADCAELHPEWTREWVDGQLVAIRNEKGPDANGVARPWRTPETFPSAALAWAGVRPDCGSMMVVDTDQSAWSYRLDVTTVTRTQFDAISSLLTAMGYTLIFDEVPHDLLQVGEVSPESDLEGSEGQGDQAEAGGDGAASESWYREFAHEDGWFWMTFFLDDPDADELTGELVIGYETAD